MWPPSRILSSGPTGLWRRGIQESKETAAAARARAKAAAAAGEVVVKVTEEAAADTEDNNRVPPGANLARMVTTNQSRSLENAAAPASARRLVSCVIHVYKVNRTPRSGTVVCTVPVVEPSVFKGLSKKDDELLCFVTRSGTERFC